MNLLATNVRILADAVRMTARRGRGIGPLQARKLAAVMDDCANSIDRQDRTLARLSAIVRDLTPGKPAKRRAR